MKNTAFVLKPELAKRVEQLKKELGLEDNGEVLYKAIELLDISVGRKLVLQDKKKKKNYEIDDLEDFNQTVTLNEE